MNHPRRRRSAADPLGLPTVRAGARRPVVSVVTVVYRDRPGLERTLMSLARADERFEIVVVEGEPIEAASAPQLLEEFAGAASTVLVAGRDRGPYDAMNRGIAVATGTWLWFVNAGDEVAPALDLAALADDLDATTSEWAVGAVTLVDGDREEVNPAYGAHDILGGLVSQCHQGVFVQRDALLVVGGYDTSYRIAADYHLLCRLALRGEPADLGRVVAVFHRGGLSTRHRRRLYLECLRVRWSLRTLPLPSRAVDFARMVWRVVRSPRPADR